MKILILGGTGAMGVHLANILSVAKENSVFITTRKSRISDKKNTVYVIGDAKNNKFLFPLLEKEKWSVIIDFMAYSTIEFETRVEKLLSNCKQYIFLSSARVYANSEAPITENSLRLIDVCNDAEYLAGDEYALSKARQENILFENIYKNWTVIRPYITYSEQRLQLGVMEKEEWLFLALYGNALIFSKDIASHTTTLTYGYDVARGIASLIGQESALGEVFHITGNDCSIKWSNVFEIYQETLSANGVNPQVFMPDTCYRLENEVSKYQVKYDRLFDRRFDNTKIAKFIDTSCFKKPAEGLKVCLEEFLREKKFRDTYIGGGMAKELEFYKLKLPLKRIVGKKQKIKYILMQLHLWNR